MRNLNPKLLLAALSFCLGAQPVLLVRHLEKFRTFYSLSDTQVPKALLTLPAPQPVPGVTAIAVASDRAVWYGTTQGVTRVESGGHQFFAGLRYLPDDDIQQLLPDPSRGMWVRTRTGVSHIELRAITLAEKADLFEDRIRKRHDRHGLVSPSILRTPGDLTSNQMRDDDNDGLWTSMYAAAECFRFAVTKSPVALASARKSIEAVLFLEEVAGRRGFPARSYIRKGEPMPSDGQWHWTKDGEYYWKGDTSSDEIVGHFFLYGIATDLLPDPVLKQRIAETASRIMDHIIDHGYYLIDVTGKPTRWGRWSPEYFKESPEDSPLNSVEILSCLKIAFHITRNLRYEKEYERLARVVDYAQIATRYKELRGEINYSDEELAMLSFYGLFQYEKNSDLLRRYYLPALNQWWENEASEQNPLWIFIFSSARVAKTPMAPAVETLYRMPLDTIDWSVKNSQRADVVMDITTDRFEHRQAKTLLPPDERPIMKWNANPFDVDGGSGGHSEDDGTAFLLPYWMGRYHHLLSGE